MNWINFFTWTIFFFLTSLLKVVFQVLCFLDFLFDKCLKRFNAKKRYTTHSFVGEDIFVARRLKVFRYSSTPPPSPNPSPPPTLPSIFEI